MNPFRISVIELNWSIKICKTYKFICNMWCVMCDVPDFIFCKISAVGVKGRPTITHLSTFRAFYNLIGKDSYFIHTSLLASVIAVTGLCHCDFSFNSKTTDCVWKWVEMKQSGFSRHRDFIEKRYHQPIRPMSYLKGKQPMTGTI